MDNSQQNEFVENIKSWVSLDNKLKLLNEKCKEIRDEKGEISNRINVFVEENKLENNVVEITGGKLKFTTSKNQSAITYKFLEKCLAELFNEEQVSRIMNHIKDQREIKFEPEIKRYFSNN